MTDKKKILELLDQIIEHSEEQDDIIKSDPNLPLEKKVGKSWTVFHLEQLRTLIENSG